MRNAADRVAAVAPSLDSTRARELGLTEAEYALIVEEQGREPNDVELAMFSLLWSEHCAYKHSKKLLRQLPVEGEHLLMGPGENAGAVDVGDGWAVAFKVESHNHPSAVEPFQGAATGVGGILRDVFAVGARPIAVLDSLRFGEPTSERSRYLLDHAVAGIGHYGNSIGVPTVGGEVYFEAPYEQNCLVNAMCVGLARHESLIRSAASGPGNVLILIGARTGRDGIGGASVLARPSSARTTRRKRPCVQIGDPFEESRLLECCLELLEGDRLVALQDLGAAGLTSSAAEMASKGEVGVDLHVDRVPLREEGMAPFEVMVSESQERMLCLVEPARVDEVLAVCERWEVRATAIGEVTDTGRLRILSGGEVVGDMPASRPSSIDCPLYDLEPAKPADPSLRAACPHARRRGRGRRSCSPSSARPTSPRAGRSSSSTTASSGRARRGARRRPTPRCWRCRTAPASAIAIDCNGRRVAADPRRGTLEAVLECAANLACVGAEPLGLTNCLNFGNPEKPHVAWQLTEAVAGLAEACHALGHPGRRRQRLPVQRGGRGTDLPDAGRRPRRAHARSRDARGRLGFADEGDAIALVGPFAPELAAPSWRSCAARRCPTGWPTWTRARCGAAQDAVRDAVRAGELASAHDVAEGGLAVALAECCLAGGVGAEVAIEPDGDCAAASVRRGLGGFVVSGGSDAPARWPVARPWCGSAASAAMRCVVFAGDSSLELGLEALREAHSALELLFP